MIKEIQIQSIFGNNRIKYFTVGQNDIKRITFTNWDSIKVYVIEYNDGYCDRVSESRVNKVIH